MAKRKKITKILPDHYYAFNMTDQMTGNRYRYFVQALDTSVRKKSIPFDFVRIEKDPVFGKFFIKEGKFYVGREILKCRSLKEISKKEFVSAKGVALTDGEHGTAWCALTDIIATADTYYAKHVPSRIRQIDAEIKKLVREKDTIRAGAIKKWKDKNIVPMITDAFAGAKISKRKLNFIKELGYGS